MLFETVAEYFEKIEGASSRLAMTDLLAELFAKAWASEISSLIYLCQGRLAPEYEGLEIGMGEKFVEEAIARTSGYTKEEVSRLYKSSGDLGLVAQAALEKKKQQALFSEQLTLEKVFGNLLKIAGASGAGSQESKIRLLSELLNSAKPVEAKFITRISLGELRLGIGDPTMMDAFAILYSHELRRDKKIMKEIESELKEKNEEKRKEELARRLKFRAREIIEACYNIHSDLGDIAKMLKEKGLKGLKNVKITAGIPIRPTLAERLPSAEEIVEKLGKCAVEAKYDGFRCITGLASIYVQNKGIIPIKDVKIGDKVLTHKGSFKKVIEKNVRKIDKKEKLFRIQTYFGTDFKITEKHPVLTKTKGAIKWLGVEKINKSDWLVFPLPKIISNQRIPKTIELETIDCYKKKIALNLDFFRFIGYWLGDGFTNDYHNTERIGLIFNQKDKKLCDYYEELVKKLFGLKKISRNIHNGAIYLYWRDAPFKKWLTQNFRQEWKGKMLPPWFFNISGKQFQEYMKGWIESDGSTDKQGRTAIITKEKDLAMFAQLLGLKFRKMIGLKKFRVKLKKYAATHYKLLIPKSERKAKIVGNIVLVKILKLEKINHPDPRTKLYNLQIQEDESYCTNMLSLHNCQIHKKDAEVKIFSRRSENITEMFPEIVDAARKQIKAKEAILEGEALAFNEQTGEFYPFQVTIQRKRKYDIRKKAEEFPLKLFAFDVMMVNGKNLMEMSFKERRKELAKIIGKGNTIELTESIVTDNPKDIEKFFGKSIEKGLEGIIAKDLNAKYIAGARKFAWIKLKRSYKGSLEDSVDVVIIGYFKGRGQRTKFGLGALLTAVYDEANDKFASIAKIGTGFSEQQLTELEKALSKIKKQSRPARVDSGLEADIWVEPKHVIEVRADEITRSPMHRAGSGKDGTGYALRFPRMISFRPDRKPEEATTVGEIISMFGKQKHLSME